MLILQYLPAWTLSQSAPAKANVKTYGLRLLFSIILEINK